jgi:hypothetical protein
MDIKANREFTDYVIGRDYLLNSAIEWISQTCSPEDIFSKEALAEWSKDNGFVLD